MNRGYFEVNGRTNTGLFLRRGRIPPPHILTSTPHIGNIIGNYSIGGVSPSTLTTAYVYGTSGTVRALRFMQDRDKQLLTEIWYATGANTGTPTGALTIELRAADATAPTLKAGTLITSQSHTPTQNSWNRVVLTTPQQLSINTIYYVVIGDAAGNATNYYRMYDNTGGVLNALGGVESRFWAPINTTNGFSTNGTLINGGMCMILGFADGSYRGMLHAGGGTPASNSLKRGYYLSNFETDIVLEGISVGTSTNWNGIEIFGGDQAPFQTPLYSEVMNADNRGLLLGYLNQPFRMRVGNAYRVVMTFSGNSTSPGQIGVANATTAFPANVGWAWGCRADPTIATTSNAWSTGAKTLGITNYGMLLMVRRVMDPRT
jgi:hypothetical protein